MMRLFFCLWMTLILSTQLWGANESWYRLDSNNKVVIDVEIFLSSTCPHCKKADAFFKKIAPQCPWLSIHPYLINENKEALILFSNLLNAQHIDDFSVPSIFFCNSRWLGYISDENTGESLLKALSFCKQRIEHDKELTEETVRVLRGWANANSFQSIMIEHPSKAKYLTVMALMDAVNPCAYFILIAMCGLVFLQNNQQSRLIVGTIFLFGMATAHYMQQVHPISFFHYLAWSRFPALLVGLLCVYLLAQYYRKKQSTALFSFSALLLGVVIQSYQQTCKMNWSLVFEQWLNYQKVDALQMTFYHIGYHLIYLIPFTIFLLSYFLIAHSRKMLTYSNYFEKTGFLFISFLAIILIIYPYALSHFLLSFVAILILSFLGFVLNKFKK